MSRSVFLVVILLFLGAPAQAGTRCAALPPRGPLGLPDTVYVKGACGTFALRPGGAVLPIHPPVWAPPWAPGAQARADDRTYIAHPGRHLVLRRAGRTLWRSLLAHGSDDVVVHGDAIAFTAYERRPQPDLWMARVGAPEHLVARGEDLDGWARAGGFFTRRGTELLLRSPDGRLLRRLGPVRTTAYERTTQTLFAVTTSKLLIRSDGKRTIVLADVDKLGLGSNTWLAILSRRLILVQSNTRMVILEPDGKWFASTPLARVLSAIVALPNDRGVIYVTDTGGKERVVLLERGHYAARVLYARRGGPLGCGYGANLSLAGDGALYWPSTGRALVAIDVSGRRAARDLWPIVHRIPGFRLHGRIYRAAWASAWNS